MDFLLVPAFMSFLGVFAFIGWAMVTSVERRRARVARDWRAYATRMGYAFRSGPGEEHPFQIAGAAEGVEVVLEARRSRRTGDLVTRLLAPAPWAVRGLVTAAVGKSRRGPADGPSAQTGDARFDRLFEVRASEGDEAARLLAPSLRRALERFWGARSGAGLRFAVEDEQMALEWEGTEVRSHELDAAHAIVREARRLRVDGRPSPR